MNLNIVNTPFLLLDEARMQRNIDRLDVHVKRLGVSLRPHVKTAKSVAVAERLFNGSKGPITVSTLLEAEYFADHGYTDMIYAIGISPDKLERVVALRKRGVDIAVLLDSQEQAEALATAGRDHGVTIAALIEIDCDGERAGLTPQDAEIVTIASYLHQHAELRGVLLHAGGSYACETDAEKAAAAEHERASAVLAAEAIRAAGVPCPVVSVGSTPTAHYARDLTGVTEVRAGVYVFFDLVMAGINVCTLDDIALSVVTTVIGHRNDQGWIMTDAGWMAMSRDRGTAGQAVDQGYGVVADSNGRVIPDLIMIRTSQEHGVLALREGSNASLPDLPVGTKLRILPNHACATAAQHSSFYVLDPHGRAGDISAVWPRINGW
ncbi:D-serine deaminase, pyridoxal phosphate-dependent [Pseudidiomarina planktonica]|uniref:D-serine deaminase, pyridoxal phosphate-dependent n=1 Tax=Pseudidiomarina planktonica TaxID=1323738 RepID=A0A1Y6FXA8_9GAMM|nr:DSD1 family PLP-dependent enzyme [Pseudidiomarina planktonica]RUO63925.1 alanine racemase [Pseudidiomarina planktonica]SMQ79994.1 D-serine deaminase, pyridoxal phosphate-dependent [Pseudidiomarina planktonica]